MRRCASPRYCAPWRLWELGPAGRPGVSRRYRNRRIGEFLKELDLTERRSTGIPKILKVMQEKGSPVPEFETDEDRTSFLIRLPMHERAAQGLAGEVTPQVTEEVGTKLGPSAESAARR